MDVDQPLPTAGPPVAAAPTGDTMDARPAARLSPSLTSVEEEESLGSVQASPVPAAVPRASSMSVDPTPEASAAATLAGLPSVSATSAAPVPSPVPAIPNPLPPGYNKDQPICANCSTQTTPLWRRSHDSTHILCNACALFFKMKGRPRPISLKTDVIKSRNRSKGKSTSKDRAGAAGSGAKGSKERSESTSRSQEDGKNVRKSAPGGAEMEDDELDGSDGYAKESKVRRVAPPQGAYPGPWPYGAYPHPHAHPHLAHQPYPPPPPSRERSRSSSSSRRAQSLDSRQAYAGQPGAPPAPPMGNPYGYPPPGGHYPPPPPEGYPYYGGYPAYGAYPGFYPPPPGQPYGPPGGPQQQQHPHPAHPHPLALAHPGPSLTHAQSDSRSKSNSPGANVNGNDSKTASPRSSASPPHPSAVAGFAQYYPHPNPNYQALHASQGQGLAYQQSPLGHGTAKSPPLASAAAAPASAKVSPRTLEQSNGRVTLAPIHYGPNPPSRATTPVVDDGRVSLPSIGAMGPAQAVTGGPPSPTSGSGRHSAIFSNRPPTGTEPPLVPGERIRRASVSSNSASISDSSDGVRSPDANGRVALPWGVAPSWAPEDERRGRPERRYDDLDAGGKGKGREDDLQELDDATLDGHQQLRTHQEHLRMGGVDQGFHELRLADQYGSSEPLKGGTDSSRSRSSGGREGRDSDRGRGGPRSGAIRGRSQSTSRARGDGRSSSISSNRPPSTTGSTSAEAEVTRLKSKVAELTFLNSLMQSRLGQLEGPGRVPLTPMSGLASTPRPLPEDESMEDAAGDPSEDDDELVRNGVTATDPQVRASLLQFFRSQAGGSVAYRA